MAAMLFYTFNYDFNFKEIWKFSTIFNRNVIITVWEKLKLQLWRGLLEHKLHNDFAKIYQMFLRKEGYELSLHEHQLLN